MKYIVIELRQESEILGTFSSKEKAQKLVDECKNEDNSASYIISEIKEIL